MTSIDLPKDFPTVIMTYVDSRQALTMHWSGSQPPPELEEYIRWTLAREYIGAKATPQRLKGIQAQVQHMVVMEYHSHRLWQWIQGDGEWQWDGPAPGSSWPGMPPDPQPVDAQVGEPKLWL